MFEEQFQTMSEEKIKKQSKLSVFFLVGPDSNISEDSSTIEYSTSALAHEILCFAKTQTFIIVDLQYHTISNRRALS